MANLFREVQSDLRVKAVFQHLERMFWNVWLTQFSLKKNLSLGGSEGYRKILFTKQIKVLNFRSTFVR